MVALLATSGDTSRTRTRGAGRAAAGFEVGAASLQNRNQKLNKGAHENDRASVGANLAGGRAAGSCLGESGRIRGDAAGDRTSLRSYSETLSAGGASN